MCVTGRISDIQRFSVADGHGIRTTVFFQGCNLKCPWCHNPETVPAAGALLYYDNLCIRCGECVGVCDKHSIADGVHTLDRKTCVTCGECAKSCPTDAIVFSGKKKTAEEIFEVILSDRDFYESSGGGVTLSGGEPMLSPELCANLCGLCEKENINVIIDTALCVGKTALDMLVSYGPRFFVDIKLPDEKAYHDICGGSLKLVESNIKYLVSKGIGVTARVPVIPGYNDSEESIRKISALARECGADEINLLPFHSMGKDKYLALQAEYCCGELKAPDKKLMQELKTAAENEFGSAGK